MSMADRPRPELFFDASALFAGVASPSGAARALLLLSEAQAITITVSEQVIAETERALARKVATALPFYRQALRTSRLRIVKDPTPAELAAAHGMIAHAPDLPILVAAIKAGTGFLVTLNRRHFLDDPVVAQRSGLRIGAPGDALAWVRGQIQEIGD
jgi:predicted nucleic acid-binding protein